MYKWLHRRLEIARWYWPKKLGAKFQLLALADIFVLRTYRKQFRMKKEQPNNRFLRLYEELFSTFFLFIHNIFIRTRTFFQLQLEESSLNWPWNKAKPIFKFCQKFWRLRCWYSQKQGQNPSKLRQTAYSRKHITPKLTNLSTQTIIFETFRCLWSIYLDKFGLDSQSCIFKFILKSSLKVCGVSINN